MWVRGAILIGALTLALPGCGRFGFGSLPGKDGNPPPDGGELASSSLQSESSADRNCYVAADGGLWCWGRNDRGQVGEGDSGAQAAPLQIAALEGSVAAVAVGEDHTCALTGAGAVSCWGANGIGQLGDGTTDAHRLPAPVVGLPVAALSISAGKDHTCARVLDGRAFCWGNNEHGQLGDGTRVARQTPVEVVDIGEVSEIDASGRHTCARRSDATLHCWGHNFYGQLGDGTTDDRDRPVAVGVLGAAAISVHAGLRNTCAVTSAGALHCWGWNAYGQLGDGTTTDRYQPGPVPGLDSGVTATAIGDSHICAARDGAVFCSGYGTHGQLGDGAFTYIQRNPVQVIELDGEVLQLAAGTRHTCARTAAGVSCWGGSNWGQVGDGIPVDRLLPAQVTLPADVVEVSAGNHHTCARRSGGSLYCWGDNGFGQIGDSTFVDQSVPRQLPITGSTITAGGSHTCAANGNQLFCWGWNVFGQLGDGTRDPQATPTLVDAGLENIVTVDTGGLHTCSLDAGNQVSCWGWNGRGSVGDGSGIDQLVPTAISGTYDSLAVGGDHACAVATNGTLSCWGSNAAGEIGDGTATDRPTPTQVTLLPQVQSTAAGEAHSCAIRSDLTTWCWGENRHGQLGDASTAGSATPREVAGLIDQATQLSAGFAHTCALKSDGTVWCWGRNSFGAVGDGTHIERREPVQVSNLTGVAQVTAGGDHACARKNDGTVWCWGNDSLGQLGLGVPHRSATPRSVEFSD